MVMASRRCVLAVLLLQLCCSGGLGGKVLVWPCDMSHWLNTKCILEELTRRGHEVTVLTQPQTTLLDYQAPSPLKFEVVPMPSDKMYFENPKKKFPDLVANVLPALPSWQSVIKTNDFLIEMKGHFKLVCESVVYNQTLMKKLQESNYNVMVIDPTLPCGDLVAELLGVPFVLTLRASLGGNMERVCGKLPVPLSYVPVPMIGLTDRMTFLERVKNTMLSVFFDFWIQDYDFHFWKQFYSEVLVNSFLLFMILYLCNAKIIFSLQEMEEFVQSSGEHGIVVFSLGSIVQNLTEEKSNLIASALAQIPQKVLWRHKGKKPATLGANTQLYDWIPQNDLLGHPKTKAFITHGGMNGVYEAIYHGVPMVGIPLCVDQPDNIARMKAKGAAVEVNLNTMTSADLLRALRTVINDPSYKENAMKLSEIHHDQPVKPLDRAVFWIEFVMRHGGAQHLRAAVHDLSWAQYHSLDVIGFLLAFMAAVMLILTKCCLFCCRKFATPRKKGKQE
ncbi:UDP-glucuronosyltransferase 2A3 [Otolemur garnettii]|uniref:UDP-glucuronosyltransferase 2A3 n=1 Tax=Otolemur garnettii TaxID=30611 RepID=UPI000C7F52E2|nr:UDP-glucuronosyltransferase 2A3 [Otolemur garnettii]